MGGLIGFEGSGIQCLSSQILSKSSRNWFEKRMVLGTKVEEFSDSSAFVFQQFFAKDEGKGSDR